MPYRCAGACRGAAHRRADHPRHATRRRVRRPHRPGLARLSRASSASRSRVGNCAADRPSAHRHAPRDWRARGGPSRLGAVARLVAPRSRHSPRLRSSGRRSRQSCLALRSRRPRRGGNGRYDDSRPVAATPPTAHANRLARPTAACPPSDVPGGCARLDSAGRVRRSVPRAWAAPTTSAAFLLNR